MQEQQGYCMVASDTNNDPFSTGPDSKYSYCQFVHNYCEINFAE